MFEESELISLEQKHYKIGDPLEFSIKSRCAVSIVADENNNIILKLMAFQDINTIFNVPPKEFQLISVNNEFENL